MLVASVAAATHASAHADCPPLTHGDAAAGPCTAAGPLEVTQQLRAQGLLGGKGGASVIANMSSKACAALRCAALWHAALCCVSSCPVRTQRSPAPKHAAPVCWLQMGSVDDNTSGAYYSYRASKAALNISALAGQCGAPPRAAVLRAACALCNLPCLAPPLPQSTSPCRSIFSTRVSPLCCCTQVEAAAAPARMRVCAQDAPAPASAMRPHRKSPGAAAAAGYVRTDMTGWAGMIDTQTCVKGRWWPTASSARPAVVAAMDPGRVCGCRGDVLVPMPLTTPCRPAEGAGVARARGAERALAGMGWQRGERSLPAHLPACTPPRRPPTHRLPSP